MDSWVRAYAPNSAPTIGGEVQIDPDVFPLALRDTYQEIEADARDMFDELTDAEIDAMAEEAALRDLADEGRFWM